MQDTNQQQNSGVQPQPQQQVHHLPLEMTWLIDPNQPHGYQKKRVDDSEYLPRYDVLNNQLHPPIG